ncbi:MAG: hypothetical protein HC820_10385 [Hydrococcus sp. RM1_1_31]|nr:hypothetical protein [Hydrococcus sp. RM1_1_31]
MSDPITIQTKYYILIYNSGSDNSVASDIRDQYSSLVASGYSMIVGLRDVYPISAAQKDRLERGLQYALPKGSVPAYIVLAVMEIEAWFLAEWNHFIKVDASLTPVSIIKKCCRMRSLSQFFLNQPGIQPNPIFC